MRPALTLRFAHQPDLAATMDIQIPALAWQPSTAGRWTRAYYLDGQPVEVEVAQAGKALHFFFTTQAGTAPTVRQLLQAAFGTQTGELTLNSHPALAALRDYYRGVIVMTAPPFEALVLTMLSQNRTGEIVRQVYPRLASATGGATAEQLAALDTVRLAELIRSAGPYKTPRLAETARMAAAIGTEEFDRRVRQPGPEALAYLQSLPGVAHKTAACVLVFSAAATNTLPVDTHLFRVVNRLGLARHDGRNTAAVRTQIITELLRHGSDVAPAHFLFLLVGRSTCVAGIPRCGACVLAAHCQHAGVNPAEEKE